MKTLFIDGEYLKKVISIENLEKFLLLSFGQIEYPEKIIYYSSELSKDQQRILQQIKNLEINEKGYITTYDDGRRIQKGVDGYIISDIIISSLENKEINIYVIAGDGDLIAAFEKSFKITNKKIKLLCIKNSMATKLSNFSKIYYIEDIIDLKNVDNKNNLEKDKELKENIIKLESLYKKEKDSEGWVDGSTIGRNKKKYGIIYKKGKLNDLLKSLEKIKKIILKPENGNKTKGYKIKFIN